MDLKIVEAYNRVRQIDYQPFRALCYAPFTSLFFDTFGLVRACCVNRRYILGDINKERLDDIWNGERSRKLREALVVDDLKLGCEHCEWQLKDGNFSEERAAYSSLHALKYDAFPVAGDGKYWPTNLEFNLSNTCNLECVTCFGEFSSSIRSRREKLPPLPRPYKDSFFEDLEKYIPHVKSAQFLGGEPFLINEHFRVWDMMIEAGVLESCEITTNGTIFNDRVKRILDHLPVSITMSMDGVTKETFEKIRVNAEYDVFIENFHRYDEYSKKWGRWVNINFTLSRLNWRELPDMLLFAEKHGSSVSICTLVAPEVFSLYTMSAGELESVIRELDDRNAEMLEKLSFNRATWTVTVNNLRHRLEHADQKLEVLELQVETAHRAGTPRTQHEESSSTTADAVSMPDGRVDALPETVSQAPARPYRQVDAFRATVSLSTEESQAQLRAFMSNLQGAGDGPVDSIILDSDDTVVAVEAQSEGGFLGLGADWAGKDLASVYGMIIQNLGSITDSADLEVSIHHADRLVTFQPDGGEATTLRVVSLPVFKDHRVTGVRLLVCRQPAMCT
jgi:radical SAM protein with 4Fe4S-binding SPASM domain